MIHSLTHNNQIFDKRVNIGAVLQPTVSSSGKPQVHHYAL